MSGPATECPRRVRLFVSIGLASMLLCAAAEERAYTESLLGVYVNGKDLGQNAVVIRSAEGRVLVRAEDLRLWRLPSPRVAARRYGNVDHYPLDAVAGLRYRLDEPTQTLRIEVPTAVLTPTIIGATPEGPALPKPAPPGGFLNYDFLAEWNEDDTLANGFIELGAFWGAGLTLAQFLARDLGDANDVVRLESAATLDFPETRESLRVGDSINRAGQWGRAVRFGGVQWGTEFALQPEFVSFPLLDVQGEAALPSTLDLYVNDALRLRREVPAGPFELTELPAITGAGDVRLVATDVLGRQRVITQPYYSSAALLRAGLHDYSYEAGFVREDFGIDSNDYGRALGVATHRLGLSDALTGELHLEVLEDRQALGVGGAWLSPLGLILTGSVAGSRALRGRGALLDIGFERDAYPLSFAAEVELRSRDFTQIGLLEDEPAPRLRASANLGLFLPAYGSLGLAYVREDRRAGPDAELASASYSVSLGSWGFLSATAITDLATDRGTDFLLTFVYPLGASTSLSAGLQLEDSEERVQLALQRNLPPGPGFGYRLLGESGGTERFEAGVGLQSDIGLYTAEVAHVGEETGYRLGAGGGIAALDGQLFLARQITESFAVAAVPGQADVPVYQDNQLIARTDRGGYAFLPTLRPYERNPVSLDPATLPLSTQLGETRIDAIPYRRSGVLVRFEVQAQRAATLRIVLADGSPLPAGASVQIQDREERFPVALEGEVYVNGLSDVSTLRATWRGQRCDLTVRYPETQDPLPDLGALICQGISP